MMNIEDAKLVARDALLEGRKAAALNVLLAGGMTLAQALLECDGPRLPQVGDVLVSSWGYDQTNIDYYQVVAVTKASIKIRPIGATMVSSAHELGGTSDEVVPAIGRFITDHWKYGNKVLTRRFNADTSYVGEHKLPSYRCRVNDVASARLWHGEVNRETNIAFGH